MPRLIKSQVPARDTGEGGSVPEGWSAAAALIAETFAARCDAIDAQHSRELGALHRDMDDMRALLRQAIDGHGEAVAQHRAQVEAFQDEVSALRDTIVTLQSAAEAANARVDALHTALDAVNARADALQMTLQAVQDERAQRDAEQSGLVDEVRVQVVDVLGVSQAAVAGVERIAGQLTALDQRVGEVATGRAEACERLGAVEVRVMELQGIAGTHSDAVDQLRTQRDELASRVDDIAAYRDEVLDQLGETQASVDGAVRQVDGIANRVHLQLAQMPAGFLVDRNGHLVAIRTNSEQVDLGQVVGRDAAPVDPPASLVAVVMEGDQFRFTLSDGRELRCAAQLAKPATPAPIVTDDPKYNGHTVADMKKMRQNGQTYAKIGELCGISGQYAARLIKKVPEK